MERLSRLSTAQGELAGLLEAKLAREEMRVRSLRTSINELSVSMGSIEASLLIFHAAALKRLADTEAILAACQGEIDATRWQLLAARGREKAFSAKASRLRVAEERKRLDDEGLEAALRMAAKASGKTGVVR